MLSEKAKTKKTDTEWKDAYFLRLVSFSVEVLRFADSLRTNRTLVPVADQLIRSATSVGANVHEAQGAGSTKDFCHYLQIALKSGRETMYWFEVLKAYKGSPSPKLQILLDECSELVSIIYSSIHKIKRK
ncbi:MAG: four helix bundle protein [Candidatus Paceibacterota bacterium]